MSHTTSLIIIIIINVRVKTIHFGTGNVRGFSVRGGFCRFKTGILSGLGLGDRGGAVGRKLGDKWSCYVALSVHLRPWIQPPKSDPHVPPFHVTQGHRNRHTHADSSATYDFLLTWLTTNVWELLIFGVTIEITVGGAYLLGMNCAILLSLWQLDSCVLTCTPMFYFILLFLLFYFFTVFFHFPCVLCSIVFVLRVRWHNK